MSLIDLPVGRAVISLATALFLSLLLTPRANGQSTGIEPFEQWESKRPNWTNDLSEISYFATRCGALYGNIAAVFSTATNSTQEGRNQADNLSSRSIQLGTLGLLLALKSGTTTERQIARYKYLIETYAITISDNRTKHNNLFHGFIESDFNFCITYERLLREVADSPAK